MEPHQLIAANSTLGEQGSTIGKSTISLKRLGYNERKLVILKIVRRRMEEGKPGATPRIIRELLAKEEGKALTRATIQELLERYERWGILDSAPLRERDSITKKFRRGPLTKYFFLTDKGKKKLAEMETLEAKGFPPRPGRFKLPEKDYLLQGR